MATGDEVNYMSVLESVCLIEVTDTEGHRHTFGGVCIDEKGVFATVSHFLDMKHGYDLVKLRLHTQVVWRRAQVLATFPEINLCFLSISDSTLNLKAVQVPKTINIDRADPLFGISHACGAPFSLCSGYAACPFPADTPLPPVSRLPRRTPPTRDIESLINRDVRYLTAKHLRNIPNSLFLHPDLPVIMTFKVPPSPGSSGCPLFTGDKKIFLGIACHSAESALYYIPSPMISKALETLPS